MKKQTEVYLQYAKTETEIDISQNVFAIVPNKTHRRPRIQKKYLKQFGTSKRLVSTNGKFKPLSFKYLKIERTEKVFTLTWTIRVDSPVRVNVNERVPVLMLKEPSAYTIPIESKTFVFPVYRHQIKMSNNEFERFDRNPKIRNDYQKRVLNYAVQEIEKLNL